MDMFEKDSLISPLDGRKSVSTTEVARALGIDTETLRRWARCGEIPGAFQAGPGRGWRFKRKELEDWWQKLGKRR